LSQKEERLLEVQASPGLKVAYPVSRGLLLLLALEAPPDRLCERIGEVASIASSSLAKRT